MIRAAVRSGLLHVAVGVESINAATLRRPGAASKAGHARGAAPVEHMKEQISLLRGQGLFVSGWFTVGYEDDTIETYYETLEFCRETGVLPVLSPFNAPPGTRLLDRLRREGKLDAETRNLATPSRRTPSATDPWGPARERITRRPLRGATARDRGRIPRMSVERSERRGRRGLVARFAPLVLLVFPLSFHCICADVARNEAYNDTRRQAVEAYEFAMPPGQVLGAAQRDLDALRGGRLVERAGATWLEPPWTAFSPGLKSRDVLAVRPSDAGCRVEARRQELTLEPRRWRPVATERATELEAALRAREAAAQAGAPAPDDGRGVLCARPVQELWADVSLLLTERGERLEGAAPASGRGVVESRPTYESEADDRDRHRVRFEPAAGGVRVSIERIREHTDEPQRWTQHDRDRAIDLEWRLIELLDPHGAERIAADAQRAGQEAYERARSRGALSCAGCNDACRGCTREVGGAFVPGCQGCDCRSCQGW